MGNVLNCCCCCCPRFPDCFDGVGASRLHHGWRAPPPPSPLERHMPWQPHQQQQQQQRQQQKVCDVCGMRLDLALLDGHRETCRANAWRGMQRSRPLPGLATDGEEQEDIDSEQLCVVCLDAKRLYAFLPCGHVSCCGECAKAVENCPLCRGPRTAMCLVSGDTILQFKCPHCDFIIAPELLDGHREVCALRTRTMRDSEGGGTLALIPEEKEAVGAAAAAAAGGNTEGRKGDKSANIVMVQCVGCQSVTVPLVIMLPCGHRVLCASCSVGRTVCPVCLREICSVSKSFL